MRSLFEKKNKKGAIGIILFFLALFTILIIGFVATMGLSILDFGSDTITPIMQDIGIVGDTNISEAADHTFGVVDSTIQALPFILGLVYVAALIFSIMFVVGYSQNPNPFYIGLYLALVMLLIFGSIIMSNMYEDIWTGNDEIATRLQSQTLMTYMILYSPFILTMIALLTGIWLFAKPSETGGFGV